MTNTSDQSFPNVPSHQSTWSPSSVFFNRILRALKLDKNLYEEVEADTTATTQSIAVVILSSLAAGIGNVNGNGFTFIIFNIIAALIGWLLWAYLTYIIGAKLMPEPQTEATYGQMIRTIGFASSPGLFRIFGIIPFIGHVVLIISEIWMLLAMIIAIKHALDYESNIRSVVVAVFGWIVQIIIVALIIYSTNYIAKPV